MASKTPKSPGFPSIIPPASNLSQPSIQLAEVLTRLSTKCDSQNVHNPSASTILSDMHGEALEARTAVEEVLAQASSEAAPLMSELDSIFDAASEKLERFVDRIDGHVLKATSLRRFFGGPAEGTKANLAKDHSELTPILRGIKASCDTFIRDWTRLRDQARIEAEAERTGEMAKETYMAILRDSWHNGTFDMKPVFPVDRMDLHSIPSVDREMQVLGREWARNIMGQDFGAAGNEQQNDDLGRQIIQADETIREYAKIWTSSVHPTEFQKANLPTDVALKWLSIVKSLKTEEEKDHLRIGIFGMIKHGKTSLINSLIGRVILHAKETAATAWPMVVRHEPGRRSPQLRIDPDHFEPYIKFLRKHQFSSSWEKYEKLDNTEQAEKRGFDIKGIISKLNKFLSLSELKILDSIEEPFKFDPVYTDHEGVVKALKDINHLMRCCYNLASKKHPFPPFQNMKWPTLLVEFAAFGSREERIELLDLPGLGEKGTQMPEHIFEYALKSGVHGCLLAVHRTDHGGENLSDIVKMQAYRASDEPLLAAFATHSDRKPDDETILLTIAESVWQNNRAKERVVFCAPGLYASFVSAHLHSFHDDDKGTNTEMLEKLPNHQKELPLKDLDKYWASLPCVIGVHDILGGMPKDCREYYEEFTREEWKKTLERSIKFCKQGRVSTHFEKYVLRQGANRRQLYALMQARGELRGLVAAQSDLITMLHNILIGQEEDAAASSERLSVKALAILEPWHKNGEEKLEEVRKTLDTELGEILKSANEVVNDEVKRRIPDVERVLETQDEAIDLLNTLEGVIKLKLTRLAAKYVADIRGTAKEAWAARLKSLTNKLREVHMLLPLELVDTLEANAVDPSQAVREAAANRIAREATNPNEAEDDWKNAMEKSWLAHQSAQAEVAGIPLELDLSKAEATVVEFTNQLGFLLRAPVSGNAKELPLISNANWPTLTGRYPARLTSIGVISTFTNVVIDPWIDVLGRECQTCVLGSMSTASTVADEKLKAIIERRAEWYGQTKNIKTEFVDTQLINQLVIQQARCCSLYGAIDEICTRWMQLLSVILPKSYKALEQNPETTVEVLDEVLFEEVGF